MGRKLTFTALWVGLVLWASLSISPAAAIENVLKTRLGVHPDKTRFVMETSALTPFSIFTLSNPDRVVIDFKGMAWTNVQEEQPRGLVRAYRYGILNADTLRVVLDTQRAVIANGGFITPRDGYGARFVLDLHPVEAALAAVALPSLGPPSENIQAIAPIVVGGVPIPPRSPRHDQKSARLPTIVLDPGHGGQDPGAIGIGGIYEKNITLGVAQALKNELENTGHYKVILTRTDDTYIRLRERVAKAREVGADLFISLHADSISKRDVRGLSVYTLSETASDKEAAMLADKENRVDQIAGVAIAEEDDDVVSILIDLAQRDTLKKSRQFAGLLIKELEGDILLLRSPQRFAGFAVLTAPDVPSALVELGYLSSPRDSQLLTKTSHHQHLARELAKSVEAFFNQSGASF